MLKIKRVLISIGISLLIWIAFIAVQLLLSTIIFGHSLAFGANIIFFLCIVSIVHKVMAVKVYGVGDSNIPLIESKEVYLAVILIVLMALLNLFALVID
ncbi:MAG: hypothetical protein LBB59_09075 [Campylobacteraceae bacterium]|jgi:hypothetical protein|nr:hypothetical protein [Campylobacteraceae bacterium]